MFGSLGGALGGLTQVVSSMAGGVTAMSGPLGAINAAMSAAGKLSEAAKGATGADKLGIDKKLGDLQSTMQQNLQQVGDLAKNAAGGGVPGADQIGALANKGLEALTGGALGNALGALGNVAGNVQQVAGSVQNLATSLTGK